VRLAGVVRRRLRLEIELRPRGRPLTAHRQAEHRVAACAGVEVAEHEVVALSKW